MALSCDQVLAAPTTSGFSEQGIHTGTLIDFAEVEPPCAFRDVAVEVLWRDEVMNADDLALQERPATLDSVRVRGADDILASCGGQRYEQRCGRGGGSRYARRSRRSRSARLQHGRSRRGRGIGTIDDRSDDLTATL